MTPSPIFVMSFNRPDYLGRVLTSLRQQSGIDLASRRVFLFQDGAVNAFSGKRYAEDAPIAACVAQFRALFPDGEVFQAEANLGVALNFDRAEILAFQTLKADAAIFLEDDLVLGEHYVATLDAMVATFADDERVGYVSAYGDHTKDLAFQQANAARLTIMTHNWAFALYRRQWLRMRERVTQYVDLVRKCDYREKDTDAIKRLFESWGYGYPAISQDAAKTIACCVDGAIKVNTLVCCGAYIGERGLHMNERLFSERGYGKTAIYTRAVAGFEPLSDDRYKKIFFDQKAWAQSKPGKTTVENVRPKQMKSPIDLAVLLSELHPAMSDKVATDFITVFYGAILGRKPDASGLDAYLRLFTDRPLPEAIFRTIEGLLHSREFSKIWALQLNDSR